MGLQSKIDSREATGEGNIIKDQVGEDKWLMSVGRVGGWWSEAGKGRGGLEWGDGTRDGRDQYLPGLDLP